VPSPPEPTPTNPPRPESARLRPRGSDGPSVDPLRAPPCASCGYPAPTHPCPHCAGAPPEPSLAGAPRGPWRGVGAGLVALPLGLRTLLATRGIKRWLVPPFLITLAVLVGVLVWGWRALRRFTASYVPDDFELEPPDWDWLVGLSERWTFVGSAVGWLTSVAEWLLDHLHVFVANRALALVAYGLLGVLASWYVFSIVYEALAGPFLDEIHGRLERRWLGSDPRDALERPQGITSERALSLTIGAGSAAAAAFVACLAVAAAPWWLGFALLPLPFVGLGLAQRRYGAWLAWMVTIEGRAAWASLQASVFTAVLLVLALPLYFVPAVGYFLFAAVAGLATSISLLDIPMERRGWPLSLRLAFLRRHLLPLTAFGAVTGLLLSVPVLGVLLVVPAASIGGLWLLCRLDKGRLAPRAERP